jgi:hypothetical protein
MDRSEAELRAMTRDAYARLELTTDFSEGPLAFLEKRAPRWTGR